MLSDSDWKRVHDLSIRIHSETNEMELARLAVEAVPGILGCGYACWNEHGPESQLTELLTTKSHETALASYFDSLNATMNTHPIVAGLQMRDQMSLFDGVHAMEDYRSEVPVRESAIYREVYRHVEAQHQMIVQFFYSSRRGVVLGVNQTKPFTERQRFLFQLIKEHFETACRRLLSFRSMADALKAVCNTPNLDQLSQREREALRYLLQGKTNPELAIILGISKRTVEKHVASILGKLGFENRKALLASLSKLG